MARRRIPRLEEFDIERLLVDSEIEDFIPSDEDVGDPEFMPVLDSPENRAHNKSESSDTESEAEERPVGRGQGRGRRAVRGRGAGRGRSRGTGLPRGVRRGRGRGRGYNIETESNLIVEPSDGSSVPSSNWIIQEFFPRSPVLLEPAYLPVNSQGYQKQDYWKQYINDDLINLIVQKSNQTAVERHGRSLNLTADETYVYLGITLVMSSINYPNLRMPWEKKWKVPIIADNMSRNRFLQLRNSLKVVFDNDITSQMRSQDILWKVRPLIQNMQVGCRAQQKDQSLSLDEMIIPFTGSCSIKQYCPGKPNPVGIKAFVLANPDGTVCDFQVYQGQTTFSDYADTPFGLGEKAVLTLADQLVPGHILYFDRFFTSEKLFDELEKRGIKGTGTIMKNRIPHDVRESIISDNELKSQGRGSFQVLVRNDKRLALTKWYDNKPVLLLSSVEADVEADECKRWCKKDKRYVIVRRPRVVREYNKKMGGVDLADRILAVCPNRYRTRKWTQRFFSHMIDLAVTNSWLQYKKDQIKLGVPSTKILQLRAFKMELGEMLIESHALINSEDEVASEEEIASVKRKGRSSTVVVPSMKYRTHAAKHLPMISDGNASRCRYCHYNRTLFKCVHCKVSLCLTRYRNCFFDFHQIVSGN